MHPASNNPGRPCSMLPHEMTESIDKVASWRTTLPTAKKAGPVLRQVSDKSSRGPKVNVKACLWKTPHNEGPPGAGSPGATACQAQSAG